MTTSDTETLYLSAAERDLVTDLAAPWPGHNATRAQDRAYRRRCLKAIARVVSPEIAERARNAKRLRIEIVES